MTLNSFATYKWPASLYQDQVQRTASRLIARNGHLRSKILYFGYGGKRFSQLNPTLRITSCEIDRSLTDLEGWKSDDYDLIFANQTFNKLRPEELEDLISEFVEKFKSTPLLVRISRQGILNLVGMDYYVLKTNIPKHPCFHQKNSLYF